MEWRNPQCGHWQAYSREPGLAYRIVVDEYGNFDASDSDPKLVSVNSWEISYFKTLRDAMRWCEENDTALLN